MATYDVLESSVEDSRPIELYEFVKGAETFRYTSAEDDLTPAADEFAAIAIARGAIAMGSDRNTRNLIVTMPASVGLAQKFIDIPPGEKTSLSIFRYQRDESPTFDTQVLAFTGTVQSVAFPDDGTVAEFALRSRESTMNRNVPRFTFMGMCNHILYDAACGVVQTSFDHVGTASGVIDDQITVSGVSGSGLDFVGGYCKPSAESDFRMIIAQSGNVLTLLLPFQNDPDGANIQCFAGCDHVLTGDCALVFDNVAEFGGYAFVPSKDIFNSGLS